MRTMGAFHSTTANPNPPLTTMHTENELLIEHAKRILATCKLSGGSIEFLERIITDGFTDDTIFPNEDQQIQGRSERMKVRDLMRCNGIFE